MLFRSGIVWLAAELSGGLRFVEADWLIVGELALVAVTGTIMGLATRFRTMDAHLQYRLSPTGIWLWAVFIVIRVGSFWLASALGAHVAEATGMILLSFGANRLAAILIVRRRAEDLLARGPGTGMSPPGNDSSLTQNG